MARYEDYAGQSRDPVSGQFVKDDIEGEINEAAQAQVDRNIPESVRSRFNGKSVDDVLESYAALEQRLGKQSEEIGSLRRMQEQLVDLQLTQSRQPQVADTTESVSPITPDELYENPDDAIGRVVEQRAKSQLEPIQKELAQLRLERAKAELRSKFPDWESDIRTAEFQDWVGDSSFRSRMVQAADGGDLDAATDLLSAWYSKQESRQEQEQQQRRNQQLDDAALIESSPAQLQSEPGFSKSEIQEKRVLAHKGDMRARDWLDYNAEAIRLAYAEGRVR
jgi:hypothetical protein